MILFFALHYNNIYDHFNFKIGLASISNHSLSSNSKGVNVREGKAYFIPQQ